jgi:hypothetical protein
LHLQKKVCKKIKPKQLKRDPNNLFGGWFSALGGFKTSIGAMGLMLSACLILSCLVPLMLWFIKTIIEKKATYVYYKNTNP